MNQDVKTRTSESNIYELIDLLWRRRLLIAACLLGVVLPIALANFTMPPVYEAQTTIIFEQSREPLPSFDISEAFSRKSYIVNQIEEIKSRSLAEEVVRLSGPGIFPAAAAGAGPQPEPRKAKLPADPDHQKKHHRRTHP